LAKAAPLNLPLLRQDELASRLGEFRAAVDQFNRRWYFESHETLEDLWQVTPLPEREFFQGVIQVAAAFVHYARGEYPGIFKLLDSARAKLSAFAPATFGVDVEQLLGDLDEVRGAIEALGPERLPELDESRVPRIVIR